MFKPRDSCISHLILMDFKFLTQPLTSWEARFGLMCMTLEGKASKNKGARKVMKLIILSTWWSHCNMKGWLVMIKFQGQEWTILFSIIIHISCKWLWLKIVKFLWTFLLTSEYKYVLNIILTFRTIILLHMFITTFLKFDDYKLVIKTWELLNTYYGFDVVFKLLEVALLLGTINFKF